MIEREETAHAAACHRVHLPGRMLVRGEAEQACVLETVRGREATFRTALPGMDGGGGTAIAYVDLVGRLEGPFVMVGHDRVSITIAAPQAKMGRLHRQFALLASMPAGDREELRGHRRIIPDERDVSVRLWDELVVAGRLRDLSRSGAAVEVDTVGDTVVAIGDPIVLGTTRGRVSRSFQGGFAVQFSRLLPLERFASSFRL